MVLLRFLFKMILGLCISIVLVVGGYSLVAFGFQYFPENKNTDIGPTQFEAYIISNGVHVDFVFPVQSSVIDWREIFPVEDLPVRPFAPHWISIGWGDREFYLNTPEWIDLTFERAWGALSGSNRTLLHVSYFQKPQLPEQAYKLDLSEESYRQLLGHVVKSLVTRENKAIPVQHYSYGKSDVFYEAMGSYNVLKTCNTWVGDGLEIAGYEVGAWTPFPNNVTSHLENREIEN